MVDGKQITIPFAGDDYDVLLWEGETEPPCEPIIALDTETEPIVEGDPTNLAILQACYPRARKVHIVGVDDVDRYLALLFKFNPVARFYFLNAPFDIRVLERHSPVFAKTWARLVEEERLCDSAIRSILYLLTKGQLCEAWSLDYLAKRLLHVQLNKDPEIRLSFRPGQELTQAQIKYAAEDPIATALLAVRMPDYMPSEKFIVSGFIGLSNVSNRGILVDQQYRAKLRKKLEAEKEEHTEFLNTFGWYFRQPGNTRVLQEIMTQVERWTGIQLERTPSKGLIKTSDSAVSQLGDDIHPFITHYKAFLHANKMIANYCDDQYDDKYGRVHTVFHPLKRTGRTSSSRPNLQNPPRAGGIRGIYIPPPGWLFDTHDYSQIELCALAQHCWTLYGQSKMMELINAGIDLHTWLGEIIKKHSGGTIQGISFRQLAKAAGFGFPGGLGPKTFVEYAHGSWGVDITEEQAALVRQIWRESFPEMEYHLRPEKDTQSQNDYTDDETWYVARTLTGRVCRRWAFCAACNYAFQGLAADGARRALWYLDQEGFRVVNFIHDEYITELRRAPDLQEQSRRIEQLMIKGMREVLPDVAIRTEGALMPRWYKKAESVFDEAGNLLVWTPDILEYDEEEHGALDKPAFIAQADARDAVPLYDADGEPLGWQPKTSYIDWSRPN